MQKVIVVALVAVVMIMSMEMVSAVTILDHTMCKDIDLNGNPINLTTNFNTLDMYAVSWVKLKDVSVKDPRHIDSRVGWEWILPNGSLYPSTFMSKGFSVVMGGAVQSYTCAAFMEIADHPPANISGTWHVNFYYNHEKKFTETFSISAPPTPISTLTPTPSPTPTVTVIPTPEEGVPGLEAVFAIAGLLAVAYLLRRRK